MAQWVSRDWRNVPGPHYTVRGAWVYSDPPPAIFATYDRFNTFIWRQPRDDAERSAYRRAIGEYDRSPDTIARYFGDDGDAHWTLDTIRAWWAGRDALARAYRGAGVVDVEAYFARELPAYLQRYAFYLWRRYWPRSGDLLPDLDVAPNIRIGPPTGDFAGALELFARRSELVLARAQRYELPLWGARGEIHELNVPGTFAIAQTAPSSSHSWAPLNLCAAEHGTFVARQPQTTDELERVLDAATVEPLFGTCVVDWQADEIRAWWRRCRVTFEHAVRAAELPDVDSYLRTLPDYLRGLIFIVEEGRMPDGELPALDDITTERYWQTPRADQLPYAANPNAGEFTNGRFERRHPLNVPGPFYGAETDTCETGPMEAPSNVACGGEYGNEFIYRQPRDAREVARVERAALMDPFGGHACDGNRHWTPDLVRAWWADRDEIRAGWRAGTVPYADEMFERELPRYLRGYVFFLEHRRAPAPSDKLPDL